MKREHSVVFELQIRSYRRLARDRKILEQRIDHDVADESNTRFRNSLRPQIIVGVDRWGEKQVRDLVRQDSIDFFRHRAIAAAQSSFDVSNSYSQLCTHQRARDR